MAVLTVSLAERELSALDDTAQARCLVAVRLLQNLITQLIVEDDDDSITDRDCGTFFNDDAGR